MPKIFINCPAETFTGTSKNALAEELTTISLQVEHLPNTPFVRSTVWIYINEYPAASVFHGGLPGGTKVISIEVNAFKGGLDGLGKELLITKFTASVAKHAGLAENALVPVYILIREIEPADWGIFGKTTSLEAIKNPPPDAKPI